MLPASLLLVDDEKDFRECIRGLLELHGFDVDEAINGHDALERVKEKKYDVILTDIFMPKMSGKKFIHQARQIQNGNTLILGMTGSIDDSIWDELIHLVDGKFSKPFAEDTILNFLKPRLTCV